MTPRKSFQELEQCFGGFPDFWNKKYFSSQKLILSIKYWGYSPFGKHLICFALSSLRKLTIFWKWHGWKYKVLKLNLVVFGLGEHVLAEQIVIVSSMDTVCQDTLPREQRRAKWACTCVGSKILISGLDKGSECALTWTSQTSAWSFSIQIFNAGMLIKQ